MSLKKDLIDNQKGQTLLIMFVLMVVSLSIGIGISSRYLKSLSTITQTDQSSMALAVSEAAIEHILLLPISTLEDYVQNGTCTTDCHLEIPSADGQTLTADVDLTILGNSSEPFISDISMDETTQINLNSYPSNTDVNICWNDIDMSVTGLYIYGTQGNYDTDSFSYNSVATSYPENGFDTATPSFGYNNCFSINTQPDSSMLRLKSLYSENVLIVIPSAGVNLPNQGILVESKGVVGNATRIVSVIITDSILPSQFDYVLYQKSESDPLSN